MFCFTHEAGDGRAGFPEDAPFDAIHVGAAAPVVPQAVSTTLPMKSLCSPIWLVAFFLSFLFFLVSP